MKTVTSSYLGLFMLGLLASLGARAQTAPTLPSDKGAKKDVDCVEYPLNVVTLKDRAHRMFWNQDDCIRVLITNNPFLFKYTLQFDEQTIKEDDILGGLGKGLGLNSSPTTDTGSSHQDAAKPAPQTKLTPPAAEAKKSQMLSELEKNKQDTLALIGKDKSLAADQKSVVTEQVIQGFDQGASQITAPAPPPPAYQEPGKMSQWGDSVSTLEKQAGDIQRDLETKKDEYAKFSRDLPGQLLQLLDHGAASLAIREIAIHLRSDASNVLARLSDGEAEPQAGSSLYEARTLEFAREAARVHADLADHLPPDNDHSAAAEDVRKLMDRLDRSGEKVVFDVCEYKAERDNDFSSIRTGVIEPLDRVLRDPLAFGYSDEYVAMRREGPFGDPMAVTMTVKRDVVAPFTATDKNQKPVNTATPVQCSSDPTEMFKNGTTYKSFEDFFRDKEVKGVANTYTRNTNGPQPDTTTPATPKDDKSATPDPNANKVLTQPWFFGKARLVLSGGLTTGFLGKQEFQRSSSITGSGSSAASSTVIGLKTDTRYRLSPMLYGHTLLYSARHDADAWYATFGVTANSDNKGTDPEFLLGLSRSVAQQKFFLTLGAYIGQRQKLDGGLQVGETIPATLTGELPITKSYRAGWGFGISYRFTSTKDPQKDAAKPTTPSTGGGNK